jgi:hypothetical protein
MSQEDKKTYRCTRNASYSHDCIGRDEVSARQGHYVKGHSVGDAIKEMVKRHPSEIEEGFTVQCELPEILWENTPALGWNWNGWDRSKV